MRIYRPSALATPVTTTTTTTTRAGRLPLPLRVAGVLLVLLALQCLGLLALRATTQASQAIRPTHSTHSATVPAASPAALVASDPASFIRLALPYARQAAPVVHWPVSLVLAQWGLEHGWTLPGADGWNWGNVRPTGSCPVVETGAGAFCYAATPAQGLDQYETVAALPYYTAVSVAAASGGPLAAARALGASPWDAGHYTSDPKTPGASLVALLEDPALGLQRYDW